MRAPRRFAAALAVTAAVAALASCSSIPSTGTVRTNSTTATAAPDQFIRVLARPPQSGASPTEIVSGFLAASANFDNDHAVARTYLTDTASSTWRPDVKVAVYATDPGYGLTEISPGKVRMLAFKAAGAMDARGQFTQPEPQSQLRANFGMSKVDGQWRIGSLADGTILSTGDVARAYRVINLYFLDVLGSVLVPDPVFLPTQQPGIATAIVRELLLGPTAWLAPAVRTGFPPDTKLAVDSVPVQDGIARVDLEPRAVAASGTDRAALAAQLTYTLTQLPNVRAVRITLAGVPFAIPGVGAVSEPSDWESFDPNAVPLDPSTYAIEGGRLNTITTTTTAVPGYFGTTRRMTAAATALDGRWIAASVPTASAAVVRFGPSGAAQPPVVYTGRDVPSLSFDRLGSVWFAERGTRISTLWSARIDRAATKARLQGLAGRSIRAVKVARDGARIALVLEREGGGPGELVLGRVQRTTGIPVVGGLRRVEHELTDVADVAWANDSTLLVVGRRASESAQTFTVGIDGDSLRGAGVVPALTTVAACPGRPFLAGTTTNTLWADTGSGWRVFVTASTPIYPG